jgi:hypothetical protein
LTWKTKTPDQIAAVNYYHDQWKKSHRSWQQKCIDHDSIRSSGKSEHQKTHERFNPNGAAMNKGDDQ